MNSSAENLDSEELVHLAIRASEYNDNEEAILKLKRAINQTPDNANAHFMLGAIYAELGLYERAQELFKASLELNPDLTIAAFQSGLLQLSSGQIEEAKQSWSHLDSLNKDHYFVLFKQGMLALVVDDHEQAVEKITLGINANNENPALNYEMEKVLIEIASVFEYFNENLIDVPDNINTLEAHKETQDEPLNSNSSPSHVLLNQYKKDDDNSTH